jgi:putative acetyltransferase
MEVVEATAPLQLDSIKALFREYGATLGDHICAVGFATEVDSLPSGYAVLLLAFDGREPVGCVALRDLNDGVCELKRLYVKPDARRSGAGSLLIAELLAHARRLNYRRLILETMEEWASAVRLYETAGLRRATTPPPNLTLGAIPFEISL